MNENIEQAVLKLSQALMAQNAMLATAESCTGGLVAGALTAVAGSSAWFDQGWVTYSNAAKRAQLDVSADTLKHHGAVSEQTAEAMARGVLIKAPQARLSVAITGIAGPGGASPGKPVGFVCFGFGMRLADGQTRVMTTAQVFEGDRTAVRAASVLFALDQALTFFVAHDPGA